MHQQSLMWLSPIVLEKHLQDNTFFDIDQKYQGHMKCFPVSSTLCELCTSKVLGSYVQRLIRCIYKKIHYLTFDHDPGPSPKIMLLLRHKNLKLAWRLPNSYNVSSQRNNLIKLTPYDESKKMAHDSQIVRLTCV